MRTAGGGGTPVCLMKLSISRPDNVVVPWLALHLFRYTSFLSNPRCLHTCDYLKLQLSNIINGIQRLVNCCKWIRCIIIMTY
jgi:hypothetical protein